MIQSIRKTNMTNKDACQLLKQLTSAELLSEKHFNEVIDNLPNNQEIFVYKQHNKFVGMISVFIEQKLIHGGKCLRI